jgi:hypothetical protein
LVEHVIGNLLNELAHIAIDHAGIERAADVVADPSNACG